MDKEFVVTLHTTQNLGDHGREVVVALNVDKYTTLQELVNQTKSIGSSELNYVDHFEIRIVKSKKGDYYEL